VAAVGGNAQVTVTWDVVPGASTYNLWRSTSRGGPYTLIAGNIGSVNLGYIDSVVTNLATYYYVVTANGNGASVNSAEVSATPAVIVTGLTATASNGQIVLNWNGSPGASYNVKRSFSTQGPYTTIASAITSTHYTDSSVALCQTYFYVVTVTNAGYESLPSNEASASGPGGVLPSPWLNTDIGSVGLPGSAAYCNGQFTISGSGADIWGNDDAFQFVYYYVPASTNCDIRARVASVQNTSGNAKAAVMIRESLAANSVHALVDVEPSSGIELLFRTNTGGSSYVSVVANETAPNWVRLTRTNNTFTAFWSPDGISWAQIGTPTNINMAVGAYVGLAVCAHNNAVLNMSVLDSVSASFLPTTPPSLAAVSNRTVNVGQTVALTASATDTNSPPQMLTFTLLSGPTNATLTQINNTNAAFSWRPGVKNANTTNPITLKVADYGLPNLSATQGFTIAVNPLVLPTVGSVGWSNGQFTMLVTNSIVGPDYAVQASSNLVSWSALFSTNSPPTPSFQWTDSNALALPRQFFRVKIGPPLP